MMPGVRKPYRKIRIKLNRENIMVMMSLQYPQSPFSRVTCPGEVWVGDLSKQRTVLKTDEYRPAERG